MAKKRKCNRKVVRIVDYGFCICRFEPRGDYGLESYFINQEYRYSKIKPKNGANYYRVYPHGNDYYEVVSLSGFNQCFTKKKKEA